MDIKLWLSSNFLRLNESKTEFILFSPLQPSNKQLTVSDFGLLAPHLDHVVRNCRL